MPAGSTHTSTARTWRPGWACEPHDVLHPLRRGSGDPALRFEPDGSVWRACSTPEGLATLRISPRRTAAEIQLTAWGPGADWALAQAPALLGADDDVRDFEPSDERVGALWRRSPNWRIAKTGLVLEALVAAVIEQKVTGREAWKGWRLLLRRFGSPAPGPVERLGLRCPPDAATLAHLPSWEWLRCSIDPARSKTVVRAARVAPSLERTVGLPAAEVDRRLRSLAGVGVWTSAEVRQRAHADADAVSFGDYHVPRIVGCALTGTPYTDEQLAEALEPDRPHRYRIQHLVVTRMQGPPRRGPRMAPRTHLPA